MHADRQRKRYDQRQSNPGQNLYQRYAGMRQQHRGVTQGDPENSGRRRQDEIGNTTQPAKDFPCGQNRQKQRQGKKG
jgi:hypothetical protein